MKKKCVFFLIYFMITGLLFADFNKNLEQADLLDEQDKFLEEKELLNSMLITAGNNKQKTKNTGGFPEQFLISEISMNGMV